MSVSYLSRSHVQFKSFPFTYLLRWYRLFFVCSMYHSVSLTLAPCNPLNFHRPFFYCEIWRAYHRRIPNSPCPALCRCSSDMWWWCCATSLTLSPAKNHSRPPAFYSISPAIVDSYGRHFDQIQHHVHHAIWWDSVLPRPSNKTVLVVRNLNSLERKCIRFKL